METGPWLQVSSERLVKPGIESATPGLQGKWFIHYTKVAPSRRNRQTTFSGQNYWQATGYTYLGM